VHAHDACGARGRSHGQRAGRTPAGGVRARVVPRAGASSGRAREQQGRELHLQDALSPDGIRSGDGRSVSGALENVGNEVRRFSLSGRGRSAGAARRSPGRLGPAMCAFEVHPQRSEDDPMNTQHHDRELSEAERAELDELERLAGKLRARAQAASTAGGTWRREARGRPTRERPVT
jgi:hypothetical protein